MSTLRPVSPFTARGLLARAGLVGLLLLLPPQAGALLNIDGTRNQVFVFGGVTIGYNSNVFAETVGRGDYSISSHAGMELKRRAGIIAVNATAKVDYLTFGKYSDQDGLNPSFSLELNKTNGRTTGAFNISAYRESRSDSTVNLRTTTWNFPISLNLKYPVNDHLYLTSGTGYMRRSYADNAILVDYTDYSESVDAFYVYTSKLDLLAGYRLRLATTSANDRTADHWFNVGASGGLYSKLSGTVRLGYQLRQVKGTAAENFTHFNALASIGWPLTRKLSLGGVVTRDFNTIATGASVDSSSAALRATYAYSRKIEMTADAAVGYNKFLGRSVPARADTFNSFSLGLFYNMNEHLSANATYTFFQNWSSAAFSDYSSHGFTFDVSSRY